LPHTTPINMVMVMICTGRASRVSFISRVSRGSAACSRPHL
jgi:hypothetical protein